MHILLFILIIFISGAFGWSCADVWANLENSDKPQKKWLGPIVLITGLLCVWLNAWNIEYSWKHAIYDYDKYEIVNDTTITNHIGQIDTLATFKIIKK